MKTPRCSKCNRPLHDPVSIASGMGPECRGDGSARSRKAAPRQARHSGRKYDVVGNTIKTDRHVYTITPDGWLLDGKLCPPGYIEKYFPEVAKLALDICID